MRKLFWNASKTGDKHEFKKCIQDIGSINSQAMAYLAATEPCHWSRHAFDKSIKCDHVTNNMIEDFNSMLKDFRAMTYLGLMEYIKKMVSRVPCCHALAGIRHHFGVNGNQCSLEDYIDPLLSKAVYLQTYDYMIHPIPDLCLWDDHVGAPIQPPPLKRKPGRPKLLRKRESTEKPKAARSGSVVCGKCRLPKHNSRTCKLKTVM
ncbi:hypothetical protein Ddye_023382 [Dipteronia dyeriana]|uniref:Uncharacterized protein n=1 Tax=Dipteronia dyeriana TaxID=168575 RepID=A0AAD9TSX2_9ROSI|nr:hypothetical protein Ddye_023382 [Dipteronia dyeriana]